MRNPSSVIVCAPERGHEVAVIVYEHYWLKLKLERNYR